MCLKYICFTIHVQNYYSNMSKMTAVNGNSIVKKSQWIFYIDWHYYIIINLIYTYWFSSHLIVWVSLPMNFLKQSEALLSANMAGFDGFRNSVGSPETNTRADVMTLHSCSKRIQSVSTTIGQKRKWQFRSFEFQILARDWMVGKR